MCLEERLALAKVCKQRDELQKELKKYKDTGVTPEEIEEIKTRIEKVWNMLQSIDGEKLEHMELLVEAEAEGRLIIAPCNVGQKVFWKHNGVITECKVHRLSKNRTGLFLHLRSNVSHGAFRVETCMGKSVFLTRQEAEQA